VLFATCILTYTHDQGLLKLEERLPSYQEIFHDTPKSFSADVFDDPDISKPRSYKIQVSKRVMLAIRFHQLHIIKGTHPNGNLFIEIAGKHCASSDYFFYCPDPIVSEDIIKMAAFRMGRYKLLKPDTLLIAYQIDYFKIFLFILIFVILTVAITFALYIYSRR
jgi:hypothetical protein